MAIYQDYGHMVTKLLAVNTCLCIQTTFPAQRGNPRNDATDYSNEGCFLSMKAPEPVDSWDGIKDASQVGSSCLVNEDCLYLNVVTPKQGSNLLPTMVYIHGGAFYLGDGGSVPEESDFYLEKDVVIVSMNYRLGPLGFLSTGDSVVPGNNGLKDQTMALRWVQQNIAQFGGDPNNVTIFGLSAGGASVHYQVLSPLTKGLFHRAIAQSGSALNPWAFEGPSAARARTLRYGTALGAPSNDSSSLVEFLKTLSFQELLDGVGKAQTELEKSHAIAFFMPTVEEASASGEENFLPDHPLDIMSQGTFNNVPFMSGAVSQEGIISLFEVIYNQSKIEYYDENFELILPENLNLSASEQVARKVKEFYFGKKAFTHQTLVQYVNYVGDTQFLTGIATHARLHAESSTAPVYQYYFTYAGRLGNSLRTNGDLFPGIAHGEEEGYLYHYPASTQLEGSPESEIVKRMITLWTNFAKTGNPTPAPEPLLQNLIWSPVTESDHFCLEIGNDLILHRDILNGRMGFWQDIYSGTEAYKK